MGRPRLKSRKPNHGDYREYKYHGCRCSRCRAAIAAHVADYRERNIRSNALLASLTHGTRSSYNNGCRCDECREANREYYHQHKSVG